jgi:hypothetical protein
MTKDKYIELLNHSFDHGIPFVNFTEFYSYALIPQDGMWLEVTYDFEEKAIDEQNEITAEKAFLHMCEEVEKAMCDEIEDFMLITWKEFKQGFGEDFEENLKAGIKELTSNHAKYSKNYPIAYNKDDFEKIIAKL